jgi:hypothetical protein
MHRLSGNLKRPRRPANLRLLTNPLSNYSIDNLQAIIDNKDGLAPNYRKCDAYWLLVIVNFIDPAQDQEIRNSDFDLIFSKNFEKVILYKSTFGHVMEKSFDLSRSRHSRNGASI